MSSVGLFYVGAILVLNGIALLGWISPRGSAPLNLFVGAMQVITPTFLIFTSDGDPLVIAGAAGLYLFGFTYLWVGINNIAGWRPEGFGWFSLFVAVSALAFAAYNGFELGDWASATMWVLWAGLWLLFFLFLGLGRASLGPATGFVALGEGIITAAVPALAQIFGRWESTAIVAITMAVAGLLVFVLAKPAGRVLSRREPITDQ